MRFYYQVTTLSPVILSQHSATTGHLSLDYLSGSAMLGLMANKLYPLLDAAQSWAWFHSGEVQFSPCYPVAEQQLCLPVPLSWHVEKNQEAGDIVDLGHGRTPNKQYQQCRSGFVNANGVAAAVKQGMITKTALDRQLGNAKDGSLHNYQFIEAGQVFVGWVHYQTAEQKQLLEQHLLGKQRLGRSRQTEYGAVEITALPEQALAPVKSHGERLTLWCLSDCQVLNQQGLPTLTPSLADLIPQAQGTLVAEKSFIRGQNLSLFNQKRQGFDGEQVLISKGSVLAFEQVQVSQAQLEQLAAFGFGLGREKGYGWVMVNPEWATKLQAPLFPALQLPQTQAKAARQRLDKAQLQNEPSMLGWLVRQGAKQQDQTSIQRRAKVLMQALVQGYRQARAYNNKRNEQAFGPSASQWGRIRTVLAHQQDWQQALFSGMFDKQSQAICKAVNDDEGWGVQWSQGEQLICFAQYCEQQFHQLFKDKAADEKRVLAVIDYACEQLNRYDLSSFRGLEDARQQLGLTSQSVEDVA